MRTVLLTKIVSLKLECGNEIIDDIKACNGSANDIVEEKDDVVLEANDVLYVLEMMLLFQACINVEHHINVVDLLAKRNALQYAKVT